MLNSQTRLYGIIGNPISHSLSPLIHNSVFKKHKINAVYMAFQVEKHSLGLAFEAIRSLGILGVNVTIPFKEEAIEFVDEIPEDLDRGVGSLNTVVNRDGKLLGYNTDVPGFLVALKDELGFHPEGKRAVVLGAGGAARAVAFALAHAHADVIWIINRTLSRAIGLKNYLSEYFPKTRVEVLENAALLKQESVDLVVNASAQGMRDGDRVGVDLKMFQNGPRVFDLVYSPSVTPLLSQAKVLGLPFTNGFGMLANQAAISFSLWTGQKEGVRESMLEALKNAAG